MFDELLPLVDDALHHHPPVADSSCLLVRMIVMFITTSGDGVIGTLYDQANWYYCYERSE